MEIKRRYRLIKKYLKDGESLDSLKMKIDMVLEMEKDAFERRDSYGSHMFFYRWCFKTEGISKEIQKSVLEELMHLYSSEFYKFKQHEISIKESVMGHMMISLNRVSE